MSMNFLDNQDNSNVQKDDNVKKFKSTAKYFLVRKKDLPLSCPMRGKESWSSHPRVYLPIEEKGEINCPYCGTGYFLEK